MSQSNPDDTLKTSLRYINLMSCFQRNLNEVRKIIELNRKETTSFNCTGKIRKQNYFYDLNGKDIPEFER